MLTWAVGHRWAYSIYRYAASVRPSSVRPSTFSNDISSEAVRPVIYILKKKWILYISGEADSFHIPNIASIGIGMKSYVFYSGRIELWLLWQLIVPIDLYGKVEICKKKSVSMEIFGFFYRNVYWVVLYVSYTFVQIGIFDWLSGRQKGSIFVKMFKNLLLRNRMEDEAETWHTCLGHYLLQSYVFLFRLDKNSGCYGNLNFP